MMRISPAGVVLAALVATSCGSVPIDAKSPVTPQAQVDGGSRPADGGLDDGGIGGPVAAPDGGGAEEGPTDGGSAIPDGGAWDGGSSGSDGGSADGGGDLADGGPADGGGAAPDGGNSVPDPCAPGSLAPAPDQVRVLEHQGRERSFKVHVPASYRPVPTSLVLSFHGLSASASFQETLSRMTDKSDAAGFIVVYPEGTGLVPGWNAGTCCTAGDVDDVGFVVAMLADLQSTLCIDPKRIYVTGMSNGGMFSHRLACELSDRIAAAAPVAGVLALRPCEPARPIPLMHFHGTADPIVPYEGGGFANLASVAETIEGWARRDGCTGQPEETFAHGDSRCEAYRSCAAGSEVVLCTVDGGGHTWPGGTAFPLRGHTTGDLSATDAMWEFFVAHPLP